MCFEIMEAEVLVYAPRGWGRGLGPESAAGAPVTQALSGRGCECLRRRALERAVGSSQGLVRDSALGCLLWGSRGLCDGASRTRVLDPHPGAAVTSTTQRLTHYSSKFSQSGGQSLK